MAKTEFWITGKKFRKAEGVAMSENQQALNHVVSMEDQSWSKMKLIKRGIEFKNGAQLPTGTNLSYRISSLKILHGHMPSPLKWQRLS